MHLRNDSKQTQEDATHLQQVDLRHHNTYYVLLAFDEWHHRTRFIVGYNKILISRWTQIYQKARFTIRRAQRNDNISAKTHDPMQLILVKEIHHVRALADTGTLIPKGSGGYKLFPTPKQAARIDHFCEYLYKLLHDPMSTLRFQHPVLTHLSPLQDDITDDALADVDVHLDSMDPRHQSRWGEHNIQHTITTRLDILALQSTLFTGIMCLHALLFVYMPLTKTRVKELEVKKDQRLTYL